MKQKILLERKIYATEFHVIVAVSLMFVFCQLTFSQIKTDSSDYYKWFDEITGQENSNLYEGTLVVEEFVFYKDSHKFFGSSEYLSGNIVYGGETYFNIEMKYDLYEDEVLLGLKSDVGVKMLRLIKERIDQFTIEGHKFKKLDCETSKINNQPSFQEVLMETGFFVFFKKHNKLKYTRLEGNRIYHEFVSDNRYALVYNDSCFLIKSKKDIIKVFPEYKSRINKNIIDTERKVSKERYLINILRIVSDLLEEKKELQ